MTMNLKTHTGYPESHINEVVAYRAFCDKKDITKVTKGETIDPDQVRADCAKNECRKLTFKNTGKWDWVARILGLHGDVLEEFKGEAESRDAAREATKAALDPVKDNYLRKEG